MVTTTREELIAVVDELSEQEQERLLANLKEKNRPRSMRGADLVANLAGVLDKESVAEMEKAIAEGCEQVDHDGW